jgi:predicted dehydrogenase
MEEDMKKSKLGILIHGAGWVSTQHIEAYKNNPFTEIVAISSRTLEGAQARAKNEGLDVPVFDDYEKAITAPGVDIVSVCTPQHLHADNVVLAAQAQKHIVIEKPARPWMNSSACGPRSKKRRSKRSSVSCCDGTRFSKCSSA